MSGNHDLIRSGIADDCLKTVHTGPLCSDTTLNDFNNLSGSPPILVLSYKNHAIDEFLKDLIRDETQGHGKISLIRIGGSCKDPLLERYAENKQWVYKQVHTATVIVFRIGSNIFFGL